MTQMSNGKDIENRNHLSANKLPTSTTKSSSSPEGSKTFGLKLPSQHVLSDQEFNRLQKLAYNKLGIHFTKEKKILVFNRLQKHLAALGFRNFKDYITHVERDVSGKALSDLADCLSTNHTFFWREPAHFEIFEQKVLPSIDRLLQATASKDLRVWCCAAATGEEPYTLAMLMREYFGERYESLEAGLLATDISASALETASKGRYAKYRTEKLPAHLIAKYFSPTEGDTLEVSPTLKSDITFRRFNLKNNTYPFKKKFHIIFCRNVMIYFDDPTCQTVVNQLSNVLYPGGFLFCGMAESLNRCKTDLQYIQPSVYRKSTALKK